MKEKEKVVNELIKITENDGKSMVSAKELYDGLGLDKTHWARWSKSNIEEDDFFKENEDWVGFAMMASSDKNSNETKDYAITLDFAKHLAMMAKTKKSHAYRNYFLNCEKKLKENVFQIPTSTVIHNLGKPITINANGYWNMIEMCAIYNKSVSSWHRSVDGISIMMEINMKDKSSKDLVYSDEYGQWCHPCLVPMFSNWIDHSFSVFCNKQLNPLFKDVEVREYDKFIKYKSVCQYFIENPMKSPMSKRELYYKYVSWCGDDSGDSSGSDGICLRIEEFNKYIKHVDLVEVGYENAKKLFPSSRKDQVSLYKVW